MGEKIQTLISGGSFTAGNHEVKFDAAGQNETCLSVKCRWVSVG